MSHALLLNSSGWSCVKSDDKRCSRLGLLKKMFAEVCQLYPLTVFINRQSLAAELHRVLHELAIAHAPVFVAKRIVSDLSHPAERETTLAMHMTVHVYAKSPCNKFIQHRFERMEIVITQHQQHGRTRLAHILQMNCKLRKEIPLPFELSAFREQVLRNQYQAWCVALGRSYQLLPLRYVLVYVAHQKEFHNLVAMGRSSRANLLMAEVDAILMRRVQRLSHHSDKKDTEPRLDYRSKHAAD